MATRTQARESVIGLLYAYDLGNEGIVKFVDEIFSQQNKSDKIVTTIINLASSLDVDVIAEGVETKEQLAFLVKNKCNIIQGYLYSRPLPKDDYINFCQNFTKPVAAEVQ